MNKPHVLGADADQGDFTLDLGRLIGAHAGIVANSGGGKSGLVRKLLEATHGEVQHIVLDAEDEFYTLRERYEYVIAGGDGGDVPASVGNAESLAIGALTHGFSLIVQLNDLGPDGAAEFIGRFLSAMVDAPRDLWHPVVVVVDEAQRFIPRTTRTEATEGVKKLVFQGRKRGFTALLAGTKFTELDPAVRGMVNNWMLGRVGQAVDRNTMAEQLGFTAKEGRERLRGMESRQFWALGPALSREPVQFTVADVETTPIHAGQAKVPTPPAPEALRDILQGLTPTQEEVAADPVDDPKWKQSVKSDQKIPGAPMITIDRELAALRSANAAQAEEITTLRRELDIWKGHAESRLQMIYNAREALHSTWTGEPEPEVVEEKQAPRAEPPRREPRPKKQAAPVEAGKPINGAAERMIAMLDRISPAKVTWGQLANMCGVKSTGGYFNSARKWMRDNSMVAEDGDSVSAPVSSGHSMTRADAFKLWSGVLPGSASKMMDALTDRPPMTKEALAEAMGCEPRGGYFNTGIANLRRNGVIAESGGEMWLADPLPGEAQ